MSSHPEVFDHFAVTAPTYDIAMQYDRQFRRLQAKYPSLFNNTKIHCISDPAGKRVGSGGGTLNVIDYLVCKIGIDAILSSKILIFHSGGESRRSPLHSVCGKGWASINSIIPNTDVVANPILLLFMEISSFFRSSLQPGAMVVACCDVILDIHREKEKFIVPDDAVSIVAVPVNILTAKNHGVLVLSKHGIEDDNHTTQVNTASISVSLAQDYLQKPSIEVLQATGAILRKNTDEDLSMIDTGIVVFTGKALNTLIDVIIEPDLALSTAGKAYQAHLHHDDEHDMMNINVDHHELQLDLYNDMLHTYALSGGASSFHSYVMKLKGKNISSSLPPPPSAAAASSPSSSSSDLLSSYQLSSNLYDRAIAKLWISCHDTALHVISVYDGIFLHLGTSSEYLDLISSSQIISSSMTSSSPKISSSPMTSSSPIIVSSHIHEMRNKYHYCNRVNNIIDDDVISRIDDSCVIIGSIISSSSPLPPSSSYQVGMNSIIEYSILRGCVSIGKQCIISHVSGHFGHDLMIRDHIMIQQVSLQHHARSLLHHHQITDNDDVDDMIVHIVLHVKDDVKAVYDDDTATIYGVSWHHFFHVTGLTPDDIWGGVPHHSRSIWTAKLFIVNYRQPRSQRYHHSSSYITWMQTVSSYTSSPSSSSSSTSYDDNMMHIIHTWKRSCRVSLADVYHYGDAHAMWCWREAMMMNISNHISELFIPSSSVPICDFNTSSSSSSSSSSYMMMIPDHDIIYDHAMNLFHKIKHHIIKHHHHHMTYHDTAAMLSLAIMCSNILQISYHIIIDAIIQLHDDHHHIFIKEIHDAIIITSSSSTIIDDIIHDMMMTSNDDLLHIILILHIMNDASSCMMMMHAMMMTSVIHAVDVKHHPRLLLLCGWLIQYDDHHHIHHHHVSYHHIIDDAYEYMKTLASDYILRQHESNHDTSSLSSMPSSSSIPLPSYLEIMSQRLVSFHIQCGLNQPSSSSSSVHVSLAHEIDMDAVVVVKAPARIDLAGGWSDTPPVCYDIGGLVMNVAVNVDGMEPIRCVSRFLPKDPRLHLRSCREISKSKHDDNLIISGDNIICSCDDDAYDVVDPSKPCALLKAVCIALGIISYHHDASSSSLSSRLMTQYHGGIEIACISYLPVGSGLGGSSIVAAAALKSVSTLIGMMLSYDVIINMVSYVEQIMTTGGGWQDQVGAVYPGFKITSCINQLPLKLVTHPILVHDNIIAAFEERTYLIYTGRQRLAKNAVINALRRYALTPCDSRSYVDLTTDKLDINPSDHVILRLLQGAQRGYHQLSSYTKTSSSSSQPSSSSYVSYIEAQAAIDALAETLNEYWRLKHIVAAGSEPSYIRLLLHALSSITAGSSLAGAGGGGFAVIILKQHITERELHTRLSNYMEAHDVSQPMTIHRVSVNQSGLSTICCLNNAAQRIEEFLL